MADRRRLFGFAYLAALLLLAGAVYGTHILHGGFAWDDWQNAATARFGGGSRFLGPFDVREALYEPGLALTLPLPHLVFGLHPALHLALATALAVALSLCLYALLRELGVERVPAAFAGALALVFPWSDSVRLWATAGLNQVAVCLYLLGAMFALRGRRRLSLALYLASMLTYAVTIPAIALSPLLYRFKMPWREAWLRGRRDTLVALATGAFVAAATTKSVQPLAETL